MCKQHTALRHPTRHRPTPRRACLVQYAVLYSTVPQQNNDSEVVAVTYNGAKQRLIYAYLPR